MPKHLTNYKKFFGIGDQDIVLSEISGEVASEIHHIKFKSHGGTDDVENLIALSPDEHARAHGKKHPKLTPEYLQKIHNQNILWKRSN